MNFTVYKSSAGSGKTTAIVKHYLKHTLPQADKFPSVIAITFTNKATAEMKVRLIKTLNNLQNPENFKDEGQLKSIVNFIISETYLTETEIPEKASKLLENILHNYSKLAFSTIDSFVVRIVRSFAFELGLNNQFEIELDTDTIIDYAVEELIRKIGEDKLITKLLIRYAISKYDDEKSFNIENELKEEAKELFNSHNIKEIELLEQNKLEHFMEVINSLEAEINKKLQQISNQGESGLNIIESIDYLEFREGKYLHTYFTNLKNGNTDKFIANATIQSLPEKDLWCGKTKEQSLKDEIESIKPDVIEILNSVLSLAEDYFSLNSVYRNIYPLAVLSILKNIINEYSDENNIIHLSETNKKIFQIVENEPIPFIYERVGLKFNTYLIDEFQDTSTIQWNNLLPLIHDSLAANNFNMLVGDAKQSIYRWRDANIKQFINLPDIDDKIIDYQEKRALLKQNYDEKTLTDNWRSNKHIVDFNNRFFKYYLQNNSDENEYLQKAYTDIKQNIRNKEDGYVEISIGSKEEKLNQQIIDSIQNILDRGYRLKDICILGRKNKQLEEAAAILEAKGIKFVSNESLKLNKANNVRFIISFFKFLNDSSSESACLNIVKKFTLDNNLDIETLISRMKSKGHNKKFLFELFEQHSYKFNFEFDTYENLFDKLQSLCIYDLSKEIISAFNLSKSESSYLNYFLEVLISDYNGDKCNLSEFLEWWEEKNDRLYIQIPDNLNAVSLVTVHRAKGLEFPFVIFLPDNSTMSGDNLWVDLRNYELNINGLDVAIVKAYKNLANSGFSSIYNEEEKLKQLDFLNLIYVAFTRAEQELYIYIDTDKKNNGLKDFIQTIRNFINANDEIKETDDDVFAYGKKLQKDKVSDDDEKGKTGQIKGGLTYFNWKKNIPLKTDEIIYEDRKSDDSILQKGRKIHQVLAEVNDKNDFTKVLNQMQKQALLSDDEIDYLEEIIENILKNKEALRFFEEDLKVINEKNILISSSTQKRPDRIVISDNEVSIIDYKLANTKELNEKLMNKYKKQIKTYNEILNQMNYKNVKSYLLFLKDGAEVVDVL